MNTIDSIIIEDERQTQDELIQKLKTLPGIEYIGKLDNEYNTNIRETTLRRYLIDKDEQTSQVADQAIRDLKQAANACTGFSDLSEKSEKVYQMIRYEHQVEQLGKTHASVHFINWNEPQKNYYELAEEVKVKTRGGSHDSRRPDLVLYVNGIALVVIELKKASVSVEDGIRQNYRNQQDENIPQFFTTVQLAMAGNRSKGLWYGTTCTSEKYYLKWKEPVGTLAGDKKQEETFGDEPDILYRAALQMLNPSRLIEFIHDMVVYDGGVKKVARPNQYFALQAAKPRILNKENGIIWHSQGSGKSLTMVWLAQWIVENVDNARVVIITDRDELDKQITNGLRNSRLFASDVDDDFYHATSKSDLLDKLDAPAPWLITTLLHKFAANSSDPREDYQKGKRSPEQWMDEISRTLDSTRPGFRAKGNIYVFVDECHRSQSGVFNLAMKKIMGPDAMLIGFTGTPLLKKGEKKRMPSQSNFGKYIHCYRFNEAVEDGVVLDLKYEARDIEQRLNNPNALDQLFENSTKRLSKIAKKEIQNRWAQLNNLYSSKERVKQIAFDILKEMELEPALKGGYGNAMLVCDSIYQAYQYWEVFKENGFKDHCAVISSYKPTDPSLSCGYTGEKKTEEEKKYELAKEMMAGKNPEAFEEWAKLKFVKEPGQMKLLIVCDKLLTGFDAPAATYLYLDKKIVEHTLFQAICRVNRVNGKMKLFGYIIDYRKLFQFIKGAIVDYTTDGGKPIDEDEKFEISDIDGLIKERRESIKKTFEDVLEEIRRLTDHVKEPKKYEQYYEYFCYPHNIEDSEEQEKFLDKNSRRRQLLYDSIQKLIRVYADMAHDIDIIYEPEEAQDKYKKVKDFEALRTTLMRYSGDAVDLKIYDAEMRSLIDRYVAADPSDIVEEMNEFSFLNLIKNEIRNVTEGKKKGSRGQAETMVNNTRKYIIRQKRRDYGMYDKLSKRLQKLIDELKAEKIEYAEFLVQIKKINEELTGQTALPNGIDNMAKKALYDNLGENVKLTLTMYHDVITPNAPSGFRTVPMFMARLKSAIEAALEGTEFAPDIIYNIVDAHTEEWK